MNFAIIGATGTVGRTTIQVLEKSKIRIDNLFLVASERSAGQKLIFKKKEIIVEQLEEGVLVINFTKKDGTTRRMKATLREDIHGYVGANRDPLGPKANVEREILKEYLAVYDTEKKDWRSFRWDSLIGVNNG